MKRIDEVKEVQNEHTDRMVAIQDQLNLLLAKFDSFSTQQSPFGHSGQKGGELLRDNS